MQIPPFLRAGDTIAIICPAAYMPLEDAQPCIHTLDTWGFRVQLGATLGYPSTDYFSAPDAVRLADLQWAVDSPEVQAILMGRGGYGVSRILDSVDFSRFMKRPKWLCGFSDITLLHLHFSRLGICSLHSPMAQAFMYYERDKIYLDSLRDALTGGAKARILHAAFAKENKLGVARGKLVGGNLSLITHALATDSMPDLTGKILVIEEVGEYIYRIDRMLWQLRRAGVLDNLSAVMLGSCSEMSDTARPFGCSWREVVRNIFAPYDYPLCMDFPLGHTPKNYTLRMGGEYELSVTAQDTTLRLL